MCPKGSMVAFPEKPGKRGKAPIAEKTREEILKGSGGPDQNPGKGAPGGPHERRNGRSYLENHPTKANGYYTRDLLTLVSPLKDLKAPRVWECNFLPRILPY